MQVEWINALIGGVIIGIAVSLMLLWNGRVTGISGITYAVLTSRSGDWIWRLFFLGGMIAGGLILTKFRPDSFGSISYVIDSQVIVAGLLVGFGTVLGSGCTSGHGVCGISRLSLRSLMATIFFMVSGIILVFGMKHFGGVM